MVFIGIPHALLNVYWSGCSSLSSFSGICANKCAEIILACAPVSISASVLIVSIVTGILNKCFDCWWEGLVGGLVFFA